MEHNEKRQESGELLKKNRLIEFRNLINNLDKKLN